MPPLGKGSRARKTRGESKKDTEEVRHIAYVQRAETYAPPNPADGIASIQRIEDEKLFG